MALRFHWTLPKAGEVTDGPQTAQAAACYRTHGREALPLVR
jgi:hypothetical protein